MDLRACSWGWAAAGRDVVDFFGVGDEDEAGPVTISRARRGDGMKHTDEKIISSRI